MGCVDYGSLAEQDYDLSIARNSYQKACEDDTGMLQVVIILDCWLKNRRTLPQPGTFIRKPVRVVL